MDRIETIKGWLNAYRNGWVSFSSDHVDSLQKELAELQK